MACSSERRTIIPAGRTTKGQRSFALEIMNRLAASLLLVPLVDQGIKMLLHHKLGRGSIPLGPMGTVRLVKAPIWLARPGLRPSLAMMWALWLAAAGAMIFLSAWFPPFGWFAGLLLGGSLSHALEFTLRGSVSDY